MEENGGKVVYRTPKRIDNTNASAFDADLKALMDQEKYDLIIDMEDTAYVSSVGLRVFLGAQKTVNLHHGDMQIINVSDEVKEIFDVTGFSDIMSIN